MNYRDTILSINVNNIFHNVQQAKNINKNKKIKGVVKANAYGHGLVGFSYILEKYNIVDSLCVSSLDEALALRKNNIKLPILVLGSTDYRHFDVARDNDIAITIYSKSIAEQVLEYNKNIKIQFKIDTAMNRIGFTNILEFLEINQKIQKSNIIIEGIFSHFSSAEDDEEISVKQIEKFKKFVDLMPKDIEIHIQNTAGIINYNNIDFVNNIRLGIGMYGQNPVPCDMAKNVIDLKELITLKSKIVMIKDVDKGEGISYNRIYKFDKLAKIATIPLGYADGFKFAYNDSFAYIEIDNEIKKFPIRGKICMDQLMVEVTDDVNVGDYVTFIGDAFKISDFSAKYGFTKYETLTSLSARLYKIYELDGNVVYEDNQVLKF